MSLISKPYTWASGQTIVAAEHNSNFDTIYNDYNGSITNANLSASAAIADSKLASITTKGKVTIGALSITGETQGDFAYYNGTAWTRLGAGTSGQFLKTNGATANPTWASGGSADDAIVRGYELVYNNTTSINVAPGLLFHGSTQVSSTTNVTLTIATATNWWDDATDNYAGSGGWCYVGVSANSASARFLGNNPPNQSDATSGSTQGTLLYWNDTTTKWRVIGAFRVSATNTVNYTFYQVGDEMHYIDPIDFTCGNQANYTEVDLTGITSAIDKAGQFLSSENNGNQTRFFRPANSSRDFEQWASYSAIANDVCGHGYIPIVEGVATRAIDYAVDGGAIMTGYLASVKISIR